MAALGSFSTVRTAAFSLGLSLSQSVEFHSSNRKFKMTTSPSTSSQLPPRPAPPVWSGLETPPGNDGKQHKRRRKHRGKGGGGSGSGAHNSTASTAEEETEDAAERHHRHLSGVDSNVETAGMARHLVSDVPNKSGWSAAWKSGLAASNLHTRYDGVNDVNGNGRQVPMSTTSSSAASMGVAGNPNLQNAADWNSAMDDRTRAGGYYHHYYARREREGETTGLVTPTGSPYRRGVDSMTMPPPPPLPPSMTLNDNPTTTTSSSLLHPHQFLGYPSQSLLADVVDRAHNDSETMEMLVHDLAMALPQVGDELNSYRAGMMHDASSLSPAPMSSVSPVYGMLEGSASSSNGYVFASDSQLATPLPPHQGDFILLPSSPFQLRHRTIRSKMWGSSSSQIGRAHV